MTLRPPPSAGQAGPSGVAQQEHLLLLLNVSATGLHHATFARLRLSLYMWSDSGLTMRANSTTPSRVLSCSLWLAQPGWLGVAVKEVLVPLPWQQLRWRLA